MGILDNYFKKIVKSAIAENTPTAILSKADDIKPSVYDVPFNNQLGYPFSGYTNRKDGMSVTFDTLKIFSINYDVARACINHRKRQIQNLEWEIIPKDEKANVKSFKTDIDTITKFFKKPAHMNDFIIWTDKIIEDMLVYDAITLWKDKTYGGQLAELIPIDSSTIRIKVTSDGYIPEPPDVAYQQIIKGKLYSEYSTDELMYEMMNPRNSSPYGLSPLESLVIGVDAALKSQITNSNMLSEGAVPEGFLMTPPNWTGDQIKDFQIWFDSLLAGNSRFGSRIKAIPGGTGVGYIPTKKQDDMRYLEFEKWLLMKTCALFDVQPSDIGFLENATYNNSEGQKQAGLQRGLIPTSLFLQRMFNKIIEEDFQNEDLIFQWKGLQVTDDEFELDLSTKMIALGGKTIDEWRTQQGLKPFNLPYTKEPFVMSNGVPLLLSQVDEQKQQQQENKDANVNAIANAKDNTTEENDIEEMYKWENKCLNSLKKGKGIPEFKSESIDKSIQTLIKTKLLVCKSKEDIKETFKLFRNAMQEKIFIEKALGLSDDVKKMKREEYANIR